MSTTRMKAGKHNLSQEATDSFYDFLTEGIFTSTNYGIQYANAAFIKLFEYTSLSEVLTIQLNSLFADEEESSYAMDKLKAESSLIQHRILFRTKTNKTFRGLLTLRKVLHNNEFMFEGSILDISDQIIAENQLKVKNHELEKLSMELDRFIYSASHDIRSPISTIMGLINLMKLDLRDGVTKTYVGMMEESLGRLDHFVRKLVDHAKNSKRVVDDSYIDFDHLISKILNELKLIHPAFQQMTVSLEIQTSHRFYSDSDRLQLILFNVIKNALDYNDVNKVSHILSVQVQTEPDKVSIEIFDNGIGISAPHINHVFEMFYRGTHLSKGSGIGLYTVREAVIKVGGFVTLDSEYGIGTSVKIEIPNSKKGRLINKKSSLKTHK